MAKVRVHQLAKELGMSSKELIEKLKTELDITVKSAQSSLDERQVKLIREFIEPVTVKKEEKKEAKPEVQAPPVEEKAVKEELPVEAVETQPKEKSETQVEAKEAEKPEVKTAQEEKTEKKETREEKREEKPRRSSEVRILSPEELAKRRRRRRPRREEGERRRPRDRRERAPRQQRERKRPERPERKLVDEKVTREQLEKLVASTKEARDKEKEKPRTQEEILAQKKREQKELEDQKKFEELMRRIEEKNRAGWVQLPAFLQTHERR